MLRVCSLKGTTTAALRQTFRSLLKASAREALEQDLVSMADISMMSLGSPVGCKCIQQVPATSTHCDGGADFVLPA